nr:MAG TPA: hypothetical protein [Caudoviricetes sp.]
MGVSGGDFLIGLISIIFHIFLKFNYLWRRDFIFRLFS